jgi:hypothetical protein
MTTWTEEDWQRAGHINFEKVNTATSHHKFPPDSEWIEGAKAVVAFAGNRVPEASGPGGEVDILAKAVLERDAQWAPSGMPNDCNCINLSREAELEYENGNCPHQRLRAALAFLPEPHINESDIRFGINVLLEKIAEKFEGWETHDIWRSDAAMVARGFKHADRSLSERLREYIGLTVQNAICHEAAAALDAKDAEIAGMRSSLDSYMTDTTATENRIIDAEFAATEARALLSEAEKALECVLERGPHQRASATLAKLKAARP